VERPKRGQVIRDSRIVGEEVNGKGERRKGERVVVCMTLRDNSALYLGVWNSERSVQRSG
jgi:hypothetical protein